jgi:hypothetical protein
MTTVKQMERAWSARQYERLFRDLVAFRPEAKVELDYDGGWAVPAAAFCMIRMDELGQSHVPFYAQLVRALIAAQQPDGGWVDPALTALCLRALLCGHGHGQAIECGMIFLAALEKEDGLWPRYPLRRMPSDAYVSAFILGQIGDQPSFQAAARLEDAVRWFEGNVAYLDAAARELWQRAERRCRVAMPAAAQVSWS